jgi:hypothetical protein
MVAARLAPPPSEAIAPAQTVAKTPPVESRQAALANAPAPPIVIAQPKAFPEAEAPAPPPPPPVAPPSSRDALDEQAAVGGMAARAAKPASEAPSSDTSVNEVAVTAEKRSDPADRLRAAAAAGRTDEIRALLATGVPIDAQDADGNTALMKSVEADQPAAAALLRRHGASVRRKNHAGQDAQDLARAAGDAELDKAVGVTP